jgi:hypothetical protein
MKISYFWKEPGRTLICLNKPSSVFPARVGMDRIIKNPDIK